MKSIKTLVSGALVLAPLPAVAQEKIIDIAQPQAVVQAMQDAGYKAALKTDKDGEPYILSAANGSDYTVQFYGCKSGKDCGSLQFYAWYKKEPYYSLEMVNRWNVKKRFLKAAIDKDGDLATYLDVAAVGKGTQANFADVIDWWSVMSGELFTFLGEEEKAAKAAKK